MDMWGVFLSVINLLLWCLMTSKRNAVKFHSNFSLPEGLRKVLRRITGGPARNAVLDRPSGGDGWSQGSQLEKLREPQQKAPQKFWPFSWQQKHQTYLPNSSSKISEFELVHASCDDKPIIILPIEGNDKKLSICGKLVGDGFQPIKFTSYLFTIVGPIPNTHKCK